MRGGWVAVRCFMQGEQKTGPRLQGQVQSCCCQFRSAPDAPLRIYKYICVCLCVFVRACVSVVDGGK